MKLVSINRIFTIVLIVLASSAADAQSASLPPGWLESKDARKNAIEYAKKGDVSGSVVKIYPEVNLGQLSVDEWLHKKLTDSKAPRGTWQDDLSINRTFDDLVEGRRSFALQNGQVGTMDAIALASENETVRLGVSIVIPTTSNTSYAQEAKTLLSRQLVHLVKQDDMEPQSDSAIKLVKAPDGWQDEIIDGQRVVSNGNAFVTIGVWSALQEVAISEWLRGFEYQDPQAGKVLSSEGVKRDDRSGAYYVVRKVQFEEQAGVSVLSACPGQAGHARLTTLDVRNGNLRDMFTAGTFVEEVCENEPKGMALPGLTERLEKPSVDVSDADLKKLSQKIPASNRPSFASIYLEQHWRGFPAMLIFEIVMVLEFENGQQLACADWNPEGEFPTTDMVESKDCSVPDDESPDRILSFTPGQRINISFSRLTGSSIEGIGLDSGSAISLNGGQLVLSANGEIVTRRWNTTSFKSDGFNSHGGVVGAGGNDQTVVGRYYLDGNIITIATVDGDVVYGFIGYSKDDDGSIEYVYFNGKQFSDRSD